MTFLHKVKTWKRGVLSLKLINRFQRNSVLVAGKFNFAHVMVQHKQKTKNIYIS